MCDSLVQGLFSEQGAEQLCLPELWAVGVCFSHVMLMLAIYWIFSTHNYCHLMLSDPSIISKAASRAELPLNFKYFFILLKALDKLVKKIQ